MGEKACVGAPAEKDVTRGWAGLLLSKRMSKKGSLWLTSVSMVNLMLGCLPDLCTGKIPMHPFRC